MGDLAAAVGDTGTSAEHHQAALTITLRLVEQDPNNTQWQHGLAGSHNRLGDLAKAVGDTQTATKHYQRAQAITLGLVEQDPNNTQWQRDPAFVKGRLEDLAYYVRQKLDVLAPPKTARRRLVDQLLGTLAFPDFQVSVADVHRELFSMSRDVTRPVLLLALVV